MEQILWWELSWANLKFVWTLRGKNPLRVGPCLLVHKYPLERRSCFWINGKDDQEVCCFCLRFFICHEMILAIGIPLHRHCVKVSKRKMKAIKLRWVQIQVLPRWIFSEYFILDKYSNNNLIKRKRAASQIGLVPAKLFHLFAQASAWTAQVICCPSVGLYFDISINYAKHSGVATRTFLSAFGSMSWKQWAESETWIQEEIKWKSTEKSSCSLSAGSEKSFSEIFLAPLKFDLEVGRYSENIEQWHFQKELCWFLVLKNLLATFWKVDTEIHNPDRCNKSYEELSGARIFEHLWN